MHEESARLAAANAAADEAARMAARAQRARQLVESVDTTSSVHQQGEELLEETYGPRNRRRNVYAKADL
ncbi:unnamed protein product [Ascophyllum nodosum]